MKLSNRLVVVVLQPNVHTAAWSAFAEGSEIHDRVDPGGQPRIAAALVVLSLAFVMLRLALEQPASPGRRLAWVLVTILLGPFGLLAYLRRELVVS